MDRIHAQKKAFLSRRASSIFTRNVLPKLSGKDPSSLRRPSFHAFHQRQSSMQPPRTRTIQHFDQPHHRSSSSKLRIGDKSPRTISLHDVLVEDTEDWPLDVKTDQIWTTTWNDVTDKTLRARLSGVCERGLEHAVVEKTFWLIFCDVFDAGRKGVVFHIVQKLAADFSLLFAHLLSSTTRETKDSYFSHLPFLISHSILVALMRLFPADRGLFTDALANRIYYTCTLLFMGMELEMSSTTAIRQRLFGRLESFQIEIDRDAGSDVDEKEKTGKRSKKDHSDTKEKSKAKTKRRGQERKGKESKLHQHSVSFDLEKATKKLHETSYAPQYDHGILKLLKFIVFENGQHYEQQLFQEREEELQWQQQKRQERQEEEERKKTMGEESSSVTLPRIAGIASSSHEEKRFTQPPKIEVDDDSLGKLDFFGLTSVLWSQRGPSERTEPSSAKMISASPEPKPFGKKTLIVKRTPFCRMASRNGHGERSLDDLEHILPSSSSSSSTTTTKVATQKKGKEATTITLTNRTPLLWIEMFRKSTSFPSSLPGRGKIQRHAPDDAEARKFDIVISHERKNILSPQKIDDLRKLEGKHHTDAVHELKETKKIIQSILREQSAILQTGPLGIRAFVKEAMQRPKKRVNPTEIKQAQLTLDSIIGTRAHDIAERLRILQEEMKLDFHKIENSPGFNTNLHRTSVS